METRELRYFVAVAEELHFGRAAQRLGIAQPPLSRAIQQLERRLGVTLLDRTSRAVTLTEAGSVLLREGRAALDAVDAAERRTRRAAAGDRPPGLVLVTKAGASSELLAKLLDAYAAEPGAVAVEVRAVRCRPSRNGCCATGGPTWRCCTGPFDSTAGFDTEELQHRGPGRGPARRASAHRPGRTCGWPTSPTLPGLPLPRWPDRDGSYPRRPRPAGPRPRRSCSS